MSQSVNLPTDPPASQANSQSVDTSIHAFIASIHLFMHPTHQLAVDGMFVTSAMVTAPCQGGNHGTKVAASSSHQTPSQLLMAKLLLFRQNLQRSIQPSPSC